MTMMTMNNIKVLHEVTDSGEWYIDCEVDQDGGRGYADDDDRLSGVDMDVELMQYKSEIAIME